MSDVATNGLVIDAMWKSVSAVTGRLGSLESIAEAAGVDRPATLHDPDSEARDLAVAHDLLDEGLETLGESAFARLSVRRRGEGQADDDRGSSDSHRETPDLSKSGRSSQRSRRVPPAPWSGMPVRLHPLIRTDPYESAG